MPPMSPVGAASSPALSGLPRVSTPVSRPGVEITDLDSLHEYMAQYEDTERKYSTREWGSTGTLGGPRKTLFSVQAHQLTWRTPPGQ